MVSEEKAVLQKSELNKMLSGVKQKGRVEVRLRNPKRTGSITVRTCYKTNEDGTERLAYLVDGNGKERVVKINKKLVLNLENINDRLLYVHLKDHPLFVQGPNPIFDVVNMEEQADEFINIRDYKAQAEEIIRKSDEESLRDMLRVLGIVVPPNSSANIVKRRLYEFVDEPGLTLEKSNSYKLVTEVNDADYDIKVLVHRAKARGVIKISLNRWMWKDVVLGTDFMSVVRYFQENQDLIEQLQKEV